MDDGLSYDDVVDMEIRQTLPQQPSLDMVSGIGSNRSQVHDQHSQEAIVDRDEHDSGIVLCAADDPKNELLQQQPTKRRRSVLTLQQKLDIIARLKAGEKMTKLALEYGVGKATLSDIKRQEDKINAFLAKMQEKSPASTNNSERRRTMRRPQDELVERALFLWLTRERQKGQQITGAVLMEKARDFHRQLYGNESADKFKASTGWLHRFKQRNGVRHKRLPKPKLVASEDGNARLVETQLARLRSLIQDGCLGPENIYSVVKARLHWRALPVIETADVTASHRPSSKDCIMLIVCANATGSHKLRLSLVGRHRSPWISSNVDRMPFRYYAHSDGRLDQQLFHQWFHDEFVTAVRSYHGGSPGPSALLLTEDLPSASLNRGVDVTSDDGRIHCATIPAATAFLTQPVSHFLFESVKRGYRKALIARVLATRPRKRLPVPFLELGEKVSTKEAGYMLSEAWCSVSGESVRQLWRDSLFCVGAVDEQAVVVDELLKKVDGEIDEALLESGVSSGSLADDVYDIVGMLRDKYGGVNETEVTNWLAIDSEDAERRTSDLEIIEMAELLAESCEEQAENDEGGQAALVSTPIIVPGRSARLHVETGNDDNGGNGNEVMVASSVAAGPSDAEAYACFAKCLAWMEVQPDCEPEHLQLLWRLQNRAAQRRKWN